ncbi:vacuolar segregation subunit 7-domain-containing protein [Lophiotrema nucula]|uniref:Vacuolar segregation subunit 7-domain-containing protein n=1 Tax=Lophiotrema nucula TaxID=690887 RepID=A0A6A5YH22_9PLEO|nr:vacuolar segregation subunit 7-domain-containing protein [Lophiotrema nucula]
MKASSRGASGAAPKLETVQEGSLPTTPGFDGLEVQSIPPTAQGHKSSDDERHDVTSDKVTEDLSSKGARQAESGSDSGIKHDTKGKMQEQRSASTQRPTPLENKASYSSLSTVRSRTEAPSRNMTVETETVPSIAQATIGNQDRSVSGRGEGSLRLKASNETIRPKKEKQRPKRKAPSINSGTASSKADVFEQKVASAVDEADSSDSDATFIYESNPHEQQPHRSRHHSRTPSMTSIHSLADPRLAIREAHKNPNKKASMKFANPYNSADAEAAGYDRGDGTIRVGSGRVSGGSHHHHIPRHGQGRGALSQVLMDSDSSMAQPSRARGPSSRHPSQPNSPRFHTFSVGNSNGNGTKKHNEYSTYDVDTENAADDERTSLIHSVRSPRVRPSRRRDSTGMRHQIERRHRHNGGWCRRFAGCLVLSILLLVMVFSAVGLVFATTKPLQNVKVREVQNVIASQEELMMDLLVEAVNPNIIGVSIADMDVSVFAKSKHVGSDKWWREHRGKHQNLEDSLPIAKSDVSTEEEVHVAGGVDEGTDPINEPEIGEPRTMLLGRIFHFDSPLNFDGSFFKRKTVDSLGEMRLFKPGNKTEVGGTERWEEVLEYPFELIVRGVLKYQLPLSTREHSVPITANYTYDPDNEKKKLKVLSEGQVFTSKSRHFLPQYVKSSQPPRRFDVRGRPLSLSME